MAANITVNENFKGLHIKSEETEKDFEGLKVWERAGMDVTKQQIVDMDSKWNILNATSKDRLKKAEGDIKKNAD